MTDPQRLFDCVQITCEQNPQKVMLSGKVDGKYRDYTAGEIREKVDLLAAGLLKAGYGRKDGTPEGRDKIALIAANRPEWVILDLAVQKIGAVLTPIYPTIGEDELEFILDEAQVKLLFINDDTFMEKILSVKDRLPVLDTFYTFDLSGQVTSWEELMKNITEDDLKKMQSEADKIKDEEIVTIIYTSGTTGKPKGVMLSHRNILTNVIDSIPCFPPIERMTALSFLPLNHVFERMIIYLHMFKGNPVYFAENIGTIGENLLEIKPDVFTTVPRLLEKMYEKIIRTGNNLTGIKKRLFFWAHGLGERFELHKDQGWWYNFQLWLANKLVFNKWRAALGGNIKCVVNGGAACPVKLIRLFTAAEIIVMEGYGLTETSPVISVNRYEKENRRFGTVGLLIDNVKVKIADDGEILVKGPNIMMGYYKNPEETAHVMDGDWLKTGDIGTIEDGKFLKITDRKKEIFKTSGGKYVAPLAIENRMKESTFIENIVVLGPDKKFVAALIVPAFETLHEWAEKHGITGLTDEQLVKEKKVLSYYRKIVDQLNVGLNHIEQVKKFVLLPHVWTVETGEMTPKLSLRRKIIYRKYEQEIDGMYDGIK